MARHLTSCEIFVILEQKRNPRDRNKNKVKKKLFKKSTISTEASVLSTQPRQRQLAPTIIQLS